MDTKIGMSRRDLFESLDRPALKPLHSIVKRLHHHHEAAKRHQARSSAASFIVLDGVSVLQIDRSNQLPKSFSSVASTAAFVVTFFMA
jgi:hypothetical protein